jgi:hypothetical protein
VDAIRARRAVLTGRGGRCAGDPASPRLATVAGRNSKPNTAASLNANEKIAVPTSPSGSRSTGPAGGPNAASAIAAGVDDQIDQENS